MTIQPTAVYSPGVPIPQGGGGGYSGGTYYQMYPNGPNPPGPFTRTWNRIPQQNPRASFSGNVPSFLRTPALNNRAVVFNMWIIAMILIGFDEWHNLNVLPRPSRLWDTSLVYGVLVMLGFVDVMVPLANALAIGFTFQLLWQYFQGNITPGGGAQNPKVTAPAPVNAAPPTPGANFPLNSQVTGQ